MEPCEKACIKEGKLATMQTEIKTLFKRQDKHEDLLGALQNLTTSVELVSQGLTTVQGAVGTIQEDIGELKDRPRSNWDSLVRSVISAIAGGLIVYVFFKLGLRP